MSYAPKRPRISKAVRTMILAREGGCCYLCRLPITKAGWHADHEIPRELGGKDDHSNLRPAHPECHREKSKADAGAIAKSNRVRRKHGLDPDNRKPKPVIRSRGFQAGSRPLVSRSTFQGRKS